MKHLLLLTGLIAATGTAYGQTIAAAAVVPGTARNIPAASPAATAPKLVYVNSAEHWRMVAMRVSGDVAYFDHIDGLGNLRVIVTNSNGDQQMNIGIRPGSNGINFKSLKKGLYFLTLVNEDTEGKKAFMLNRE